MTAVITVENLTKEYKTDLRRKRVRAVRDARRSRDAVARALQTAERRLARAQAKAKERA